MLPITKKKVHALLHTPTTKLGFGIAIGLVICIYISIFLLILEYRVPQWVEAHNTLYKYAELALLVIFTCEYVTRISCAPDPLKYSRSWFGVIDLLAVVPGLISIIFPIIGSTLWLRVFLIFRFIRVLKMVHLGSIMGGIASRLMPYFAIAIGLKAVLLAFEGFEWWPKFDNLNMVIGVVGFSTAVLLGTKISVINGRLYAIEDAVARIVGGMRDMQGNTCIQNILVEWAIKLRESLVSESKDKSAKIRVMRGATDMLESELEKRSIGGPNTAGFHRDVAYVLHRATATTPPAYERFLKSLTVAYSIVVITAVPGMTGFVATALIVYTLGGAYLLIDDMDRPLDYGDDSLINVRLDPLDQYIEKNMNIN